MYLESDLCSIHGVLYVYVESDLCSIHGVSSVYVESDLCKLALSFCVQSCVLQDRMGSNIDSIHMFIRFHGPQKPFTIELESKVVHGEISKFSALFDTWGIICVFGV